MIFAEILMALKISKPFPFCDLWALLISYFLLTAREGNVFTGMCHSVHNWPHGYAFTALESYWNACYGISFDWSQTMCTKFTFARNILSKTKHSMFLGSSFLLFNLTLSKHPCGG